MLLSLSYSIFLHNLFNYSHSLNILLSITNSSFNSTRGKNCVFRSIIVVIASTVLLRDSQPFIFFLTEEELKCFLLALLNLSSPLPSVICISLMICRNALVCGMISRSIETTGAALGLEKVGLNVSKVHRNLTYGTAFYSIF